MMFRSRPYHLFCWGDVVIASCTACGIAAFFLWSWHSTPSASVEIRATGTTVATVPLRLNRTLHIQGLLGISEIEIKNGRVRIARDPSPRQYCVRQGWLERPYQTALCLPNQVSVHILGSGTPHDSLAF